MGRLSRIGKQFQLSCKSYMQRLLREGKDFRDCLEKVEELERLGEEGRIDFQLASLKKIATYAAEHVPHWRKTFLATGFEPERLISVDELKKLPLLSKKEVQADIGSFISDNVAKWRLTKGVTSGTTGTPGIFFRDIGSIVFENALMWHLRRQAGMEPGCRLAWVRGDVIIPSDQRHPPFWMRNYGANLLAVSSYHLVPKYRKEILQAIDRFNPAGAFAYPSAAFVLARWGLESGRKLPFPNLHTSSETVLTEQRDVFRSTLSGKWVDHYGQAERVNFLASLNGGEYREYTEYGITELLPLGDGRFEIIGTGLHNFAMPLFRYRTGDIVKRRIDDGNARPVIEGLAGRKEDFVILPDGGLVGRLAQIFKGLRNIEEGQIYQSRVDHIAIRIVPSQGYSGEDEKQLLSNARERLGNLVEIEIEHMESIPRTKNGKLKFVVSDIKIDGPDAN